MSKKVNFTSFLLIREMDNTKCEVNGCVISDVMKFFKGDGPAIQLESGNQKGGWFFCPCCTVHVADTNNYNKVLNIPYTDLQDRIDSLTKSSLGLEACRNDSFHILDVEKMDRVQIENELHMHEPQGKKSFISGKTSMETLKGRLKTVYKGVRRPLLLNEGTKIPDQLSDYEISPIEPLHDCVGHLKNIWKIFPELVPASQKKAVEKIMRDAMEVDYAHASNGTYRRAIITVHN